MLKTKFFLLAGICAFMVIVSSCKKDPCKDWICLNGGAVLYANEQCSCVCPNPYFGTFCEQSDPCFNTTCLNGGSAVASGSNCSCNCPIGYEGTYCQTPVREKYLGSYNGGEVCNTGIDSYGVTITVGTSNNRVVINNIYDMGFNTNAEINASGNLDIPQQAFGTGQISGSGSISGNTLTLNFTITSGGLSDTCTGTFTK